MSRRRAPAAPRPAAAGESEPDDATDDGRRIVRRRTPLPNGRAVVGGLLVAVAGLGVAGAHLQAGATTGRPVVVAAVDLAPGSTLSAEQLRVEQLDLSPTLAQGSFTDPESLVGGVLLGPVAQGELLQAGSLAPEAGGDVRPARELTVALDRDRAVDGRLAAGEQVDLLATYGTGEQSSTRIVARRATVRQVSTADDGGFASSGQVSVSLALADEEELLAATHAARSDALTLVRTTGVDPAGSLDDEPYRPDQPSTAADEPTGADAETTTEARS